MPLNTISALQPVSENCAQWVLPEMLRDLALEGDPELVTDLIGVFRADTAQRLRETRVAVASGDRELLKAQVHSIKGSSGQMGATTLAAICELVEFATRETPVSQLLTQLDAAETEFSKVCRAMASYSLTLAPPVDYKSTQRAS